MNNPRTLASNHKAVPQFPVRPFQILTLLDMLEFFAHNYYLFITKFDQVGCRFHVAEWERGKQSPAKPEELDELRHATTVLSDELKQAGVNIFQTTLDRFNEIREDCDDDPPPVVVD